MGKKKIETPEEADVPISSMIDIIFLLIIFFVVTAAIDKEIEDEKVILADAPHGRPLKKKDPRSVTINIRADGSMNIGMVPVGKAEIINRLTAAAAKYGNDIPIVIRADGNTQHEHVRQVMAAITDTGLYKVKFNAVINGPAPK